MKKSLIYILCAFMAGLVILACGLPFFEVQMQQKDIDSISASIAQTMVALNQQNQPAQLSNADLLATAVAQTVVALNQQASVAATATPIPYQYMYVPPVATPYPCNSATLISETYTDHTYVDLDQYFNKSWRLQNTGTCTWNTGYRLAFYSGNSMSAPSYVNIPYTVVPGGIVDVIVPMRAPATAGVYTGYWGLYTETNYYFGKVWVTINAGTTSYYYTPSYFAVTHVTVSGGDQPAFPCVATYGGNIYFQAYITTNAGGTVTYKWRKIEIGGTTVDGTTKTATFGAADTVMVSDTLTGFVALKTYDVNILIVSPNNQEFSGVTIVCAS